MSGRTSRVIALGEDGKGDLAPFSAISPGRFWLITPGYRAQIHKLITHAGPLGLGIEARWADCPPTVQHHRAPSFLRLDIEANDVAAAAFITDGRDHALDLAPRRHGKQRSIGGFA